ncbi:MAG: hypothetical protein WDN75_07330 [Bacteroidota bacterium]
MFDAEKDMKHTQPSFVIFLGERRAKMVVGCLFGVQILLTSYLIFATPCKMETITLLAMNSVLSVLFIFHDHFKKEDNYRLIGDIIFLFPLIYLIVNG